MQDMSPRAISVLKSVSLILAEDTRTSGVLMKKFEIGTPMVSYHKFNEHQVSSQILDRIEAGETMALVSDAGTPGISDPGFLLSRECRARDIEVETLPGPTAFVPALVNSGLPCDRFVFEGFLPQKKGRATRLKVLADDCRTFVIYESPLRLVRTISQLIEVCGAERQYSVSREISKIHNETMRGSLSFLLEYYMNNSPKGEIVIVVAGKQEETEIKVHRNKYKDSDV